MTSTGRFITFEGVDGAGKSTHIDWYADQLRAAGHTVVLTREPGGSNLAEKIRQLVLNDAMSPLTELLLISAARHDHLIQTIEPALKLGHWVICDRFSDSTLAYQGGGREMSISQIQTLTQWATDNRQPDRTYLFDLDVEQAAARRRADRQADRFEAEQTAFFNRVRAAYQQLATQSDGRICIIDASQAIDQIRSELQTDLDHLTAR